MHNWGYYISVLIILLNQANAFAVGLRGVANGIFEEKEIKLHEPWIHELTYRRPGSSSHITQTNLHTAARFQSETRKQRQKLQIRITYPLMRFRLRSESQRGRTRRKYNEENLNFMVRSEITEFLT